jgi:SAM-dependent methyltransferase
VSDEQVGFTPVERCWICGATTLRPVATALFEHSEYARQDPPLARYTGATVRLLRCAACGFGQPEALPSLPDYFGRMYDQRWSEAWMEEEFRARNKDRIFHEVLRGLAVRLPPERRRLLDVGAHVGRFLRLASERGWEAEGVELNPATSAHAARATGLPVHRADLRDLSAEGRRYDAVTLTDVLEHVPEPGQALEALRGLLAPGGWVAIKVPHGPAQLFKERLRGRLFRGYRPTVADNLVHVSHFTPRALRLALASAGFDAVRVRPAAPELPASAPRRALVRAVVAAARLTPRGERTPLAMNLQAFARVPGG